ncbi:MAG: helix-turn-helix transcriptional regulator [Planctomycetota bacterium]|nr:helix-turn-helix transcriptional regulator [Planctomycetota bacterium]
MKSSSNSDWMKGSLDLMVLSVLASGSKYGYLLQQELQQASGGLVELQAGTMYPLLHRLEAEEWIRSRWDETTGRRRKWYELTDAGRNRLTQQAREWESYADCIRALLARVIDPVPRPA